MNKTLAATVLACASVFGVAANADARDWGHDRHDRHGYDYNDRNPGRSAPRFIPAPRYYAPPPPRVVQYCTNTPYGSVRQNYDNYTHRFSRKWASNQYCPY